MLRTGPHGAAVAERCVKKYHYGLEFFLGLYHDVLEDKLFTLEEVKEDFYNETHHMKYVVCRLPELIEALIAITRNPGEKYFDYIERCSRNALAKRVKIEDLMENRYARGECPG